MGINIIKKFWFQAAALLTFIFFVSIWALNPISNQNLNEAQSRNLLQLSDVYKSLVGEKINKVNSEINYFIAELEDTNKESIDSVNTPLKAIMELESKGEQLVLTGNELRSVDLAYWNADDVSKEINRIFYLDNDFIYDEYLKIEAPNGESLFGVLKAINGKFYFSILNLHFSSDWSSQFNVEDARLVVTNTIGEVLYHPEVQYIGSSFPDFEDIDYGASQSDIKESRGDLMAFQKIKKDNLLTFVTTEKWEKPFNYTFYLKLLFCLTAILLLFYLMYENFKKFEVKSLKFNSKDLKLNGGYLEKLQTQNNKLNKEIQKLENQLASQKEYVGNEGLETALFEIKAKVAHLVGQVQLVQASPADINLMESLDLKTREIYKKVYQLLDNDDKELIVRDTSAPESEEYISKMSSSNEISYKMTNDYDFYDASDRIEITENDIGEEELALLGNLPRKKNKMELKDIVIDESKIEQSISQQLDKQSYKKKSFSIEENFLEEQKKKIINFNDENSFSDQIKQVDELLVNVDSKLSRNKVKDIIRKPKLNK